MIPTPEPAPVLTATSGPAPSGRKDGADRPGAPVPISIVHARPKRRVPISPTTDASGTTTGRGRRPRHDHRSDGWPLRIGRALRHHAAVQDRETSHHPCYPSYPMPAHFPGCSGCAWKYPHGQALSYGNGGAGGRAGLGIFAQPSEEFSTGRTRNGIMISSGQR